MLRILVLLLALLDGTAIAEDSFSYKQEAFAPVELSRVRETMTLITVHFTMKPARCRPGPYTLILEYAATPYRPDVFDADLRNMSLYPSEGALLEAFEELSLHEWSITLAQPGSIALSLVAPNETTIGNVSLEVRNRERVVAGVTVPICVKKTW